MVKADEVLGRENAGGFTAGPGKIVFDEGTDIFGTVQPQPHGASLRLVVQSRREADRQNFSHTKTNTHTAAVVKTRDAARNRQRPSKSEGRDASPRGPTLAAEAAPIPPLRFRQNGKRPVPPIVDQSGANGIVQNIPGFLLKILLTAQAVLEKIPLPIESQRPRGPSFPVPHAFGRIRFWRKSENQMDMVGHDLGGMDPPNSGLHAMEDRVSNSPRRIRRGKRPKAPILRATGNEKHGTLDIDPQRKIMRQRFAADFHGKRI